MIIRVFPRAGMTGMVAVQICAGTMTFFVAVLPNVNYR